MAFVLYRNLGAYLSTENASVRLSSDAVYPNYSVIVNSPVITASINKDSNKVYLSEPVVFTVKHLQVRTMQGADFFFRIKDKAEIVCVARLKRVYPSVAETFTAIQKRNKTH